MFFFLLSINLHFHFHFHFDSMYFPYLFVFWFIFLLSIDNRRFFTNTNYLVRKQRFFNDFLNVFIDFYCKLFLFFLCFASNFYKLGIQIQSSVYLMWFNRQNNNFLTSTCKTSIWWKENGKINQLQIFHKNTHKHTFTHKTFKKLEKKLCKIIKKTLQFREFITSCWIVDKSSTIFHFK